MLATRHAFLANIDGAQLYLGSNWTCASSKAISVSIQRYNH